MTTSMLRNMMDRVHSKSSNELRSWIDEDFLLGLQTQTNRKGREEQMKLAIDHLLEALNQTKPTDKAAEDLIARANRLAAMLVLSKRGDSIMLPENDLIPIERAFKALYYKDILVLPSLTCCPTCCSGQMAVISACGRCHGSHKSFVYYDHQDARQAEETGTLLIGFSAFRLEGQSKSQHLAACIAAANELVKALRSVGLEVCGDGLLDRMEICSIPAGLSVRWDGDPNNRVEVCNIPRADRSFFKLTPEAAEWVDAIAKMGRARGEAPYAKCSHTCGSGVSRCMHGVGPDDIPGMTKGKSKAAPRASTSSAAATPVCAHCDKSAAGAGVDKLLRCSRCKDAYYCNKSCQTLHWKRHKPHCVVAE